MAGVNGALISRNLRQLTFGRYKHLTGPIRSFSSKDTDKADEGPRLREFRKKLREQTPIEKLEELEEGKHPYQEKEPLKPFPNNTNPETGEIGGPRGPEPTRYGDWERKGRVTDF
ncbi:succinate dehydrogenase assembly factor 4, mitochondrial [Harpegnathos saltator]|uniref:succinate dehydrogenase assembly factor 4, mitochondrial n=1 Tax=Harpegnathos saltator TaxID=610380 RepID=UPI000DBEDB32|nr:succinate dehydrogenase assembly factor 4, mitochondrial [Harpegnathos saltator]XP_011137803.2 succinate dehydrogenase assembly factor 4, mitochondrial [Harpegnathos saltator]